MANRTDALRRRLQLRRDRLRRERELQTKRAATQDAVCARQEVDDRNKRRRRFRRAHGKLLDRKMCQACVFARLCDPLAAVGVWNALSRHRDSPSVPQHGSLCGAALRVIRVKLRGKRTRHPRRYQAVADARHAVDRALLYNDDSHLEAALNVWIPEPWKRIR